MFKDFDDDIFGQPYRTISNGEESVNIYKRPDGELISDEGTSFGNINDDEIDDKLDSFESEWRETHWSKSDWADYYGCDESQVDDCMDDDIKGCY